MSDTTGNPRGSGSDISEDEFESLKSTVAGIQSALRSLPTGEIKEFFSNPAGAILGIVLGVLLRVFGNAWESLVDAILWAWYGTAGTVGLAETPAWIFSALLSALNKFLIWPIQYVLDQVVVATEGLQAMAGPFAPVVTVVVVGGFAYVIVRAVLAVIGTYVPGVDDIT